MFRKVITPIFLFFLFFIVRYYDVLLEYKIFGNGKDLVHLLGPVFSSISSLIRSGQTPLFLEEILGGVPFYNSAMFSFTYPLYFFNFLDYGVGERTLRIITLVTVFHLFLLFLNNVILLRVIGFRSLISVVSAFTIILCFNTACNANWIIAISGYAWIPLFFAGIIAIVKWPNSYWGVILMSLGSLGFLAKPAQTAILSIFFGAIISIVGLIKNGTLFKPIIFKFLLAGIIMFGINAVGLLQLFLDFPDLMRFTPNGAVHGNDVIPIDSYQAQVSLNQISNYILLTFRNIKVGHPYVGPLAVLSFLLSIYYIFRNIKGAFELKWEVGLFFWFTVVTILFAFGKELPTFWIHYKTPLLNKIRESTRFLMITNIGFTVLIAYIIGIVKEKWLERDGKILSLIILYVSAAVFFAQLGVFYRNYYLVLWTFCFIPIHYIIFIRRNNHTFSKWIMFIILILLGLSIMIPSGRYGKKKAKNTGYNDIHNKSSVRILNKLKEEVEDSLNHYRCVYNTDDFRDGEWSNNALYKGLRSFQGTIVVMPYNQYLELWHLDNMLEYRSLWGAKWYIYPKGTAAPGEGFTKLVENSDHIVYENKYALPRAYFPSKIIPFDGDWKSFKRKINNKKILPLAYISKEEIDVVEVSRSRKKVNSIDYFNNIITIKTEQKESSLLVLNEYYSKHWKAYVNNELSSIIRTNTNQMSVQLPAGKNELSLSYKPYPFIYFHFLQKITFVILFFLILWQLYIITRSRLHYMLK